jgi:hypothetical protein
MTHPHTSYDDEDHLKTLALRLLGAPFPGKPQPDYLELVVDALPADLPFTLPLPKGANILGSLVEDGDMAHIVINAPISENRLLMFYRNELLVNEWRELPSQDLIGGFQQVKTVHFVQDHIGVRMSISLHKVTADQTDAHFYIYFGKLYTGFVQPSRPPTRITPLLPILDSPDNAKTILYSGGARGDYCYSMISLETSLDVIFLETHYREQLSRAGWESVFHTTMENLALSTWTGALPYRDYQLEGILLVLNMTNRPDRRFALLYTEFFE